MILELPNYHLIRYEINMLDKNYSILKYYLFIMRKYSPDQIQMGRVFDWFHSLTHDQRKNILIHVTRTYISTNTAKYNGEYDYIFLDKVSTNLYRIFNDRDYPALR